MQKGKDLIATVSTSTVEV